MRKHLVFLPVIALLALTSCVATAQETDYTLAGRVGFVPELGLVVPTGSFQSTSTQPTNTGRLSSGFAKPGYLLGGMFPYLFAAQTIQAVGRAANQMIEEVRRQFREIPGLREGNPEVKPEYEKCVDISTRAALREMILPGALAVALPLIVGFISLEMLGGLLAGALISGFLLAIYMANAGGAWDNAKKFIEAGAFGGKGSESHKAAVVGDTVGDPFKDTSGPAMNIVIKVMTIVSLIFASAFVSYGLF